jgi:hypothetical protein
MRARPRPHSRPPAPALRPRRESNAHSPEVTELGPGAGPPRRDSLAGGSYDLSAARVVVARRGPGGSAVDPVSILSWRILRYSDRRLPVWISHVGLGAAKTMSYDSPGYRRTGAPRRLGVGWFQGGFCSPRRSGRSRSRAGVSGHSRLSLGPQGPELLHHGKLVGDPPVFDHAAPLESEDVDHVHRDIPAGSWQAHELPAVCSRCPHP